MIELGELEAKHEAFAKRDTRVVVVSLEDADEAKKTQKDFPHLVVVADSQRNLIEAVEVLHRRAGPGRTDTAAPTTIFIDRRGSVRSLYQSGKVISRLSAKEVLDRVAAELAPAR